MTRIRVLQLLIGISLAIHAFGFIEPYLSIRYSPHVEALLNYDGSEGYISPYNPLLNTLSSAGRVFISFGLILFFRWARWAFLILVVFNFVVIPFLGVVIYPPIIAFMAFVSVLFDGIILALVFGWDFFEN